MQHQQINTGISICYQAEPHGIGQTEIHSRQPLNAPEQPHVQSTQTEILTGQLRLDSWGTKPNPWRRPEPEGTLQSFDEGHSHLFGNDNFMVIKDGKSIHISLMKEQVLDLFSKTFTFMGFSMLLLNYLRITHLHCWCCRCVVAFYVKKPPRFGLNLSANSQRSSFKLFATSVNRITNDNFKENSYFQTEGEIRAPTNGISNLQSPYQRWNMDAN
ncbi:unnamed protein product [Fraxinus pennsylvanica]|uniref:Uncharacterized protein n=1 Tax=Fraxinus pennsylvanica TaxID=56036 RepID=A0AAD1ZAZ1_9LAMI|nr:unnamed protein product [Fraxinus pennsylvanica]